MTVKKYLKESIRVGDRDLTVEVGRVAFVRRSGRVIAARGNRFFPTHR